MGRLKGIAPPAPATPSCKRLRKDNSSPVLSIVAAFDDLVRDSKVLSEGSAEEEFLEFVKNAEEWRGRWAHAEVECQRLQTEMSKIMKEISLKDFKIQQARNFVEEERKRRQVAENERDALRNHIQILRDFILGENNEINDVTREKIRNYEKSMMSTSKYGSHSNLFFQGGGCGRATDAFSPQHHTLNRLTEESAESILDVSDLSYDETCDESRLKLNTTHNAKRAPRRSSINPMVDDTRSRRRSAARSVATEGERIVATTTVTLVDGKQHAESTLKTETLQKPTDEAVMETFEERAKKSRRSRESRRVTYNDQPMEQEYEPSAPPAPLFDEDDGLLDDPCWSKGNKPNGIVLSPMSPNVHSPCAVPQFYTSQNPIKRTFSNAGSISNRLHYLVRKKVFREEDCGPCGGKIKIGRSRYKCRDCGTTAHMDCKETIPLPCVQASLTPIKPGYYISDYTPLSPPMIPALLIHCLREIEARGLTELGLYRVCGAEKEAQELLDKFFRNKGAPPLCKYDLGAITSCVKKFLRSLKEPLVPQSLWRRFVEASTNPDTTDAEAAVIQCIAELPRPNRDTMAFLILHFQKIAASPETKMCVENIARIFGPTIVGYSSSDPTAMLSETPLQKDVMSALLNISSDYWKTFVNVTEDTPSKIGSKYVATPENGFTFNTPGTFRAPSERKSKKFKSLHVSRPMFQSPML
ncbi:rac GTPase-activating protein 1-like [Lepeophtheirus salmonis]|uniref:rac GTPase-activating protein 1-like n=1 Tax=Lepeophtheirus salmonis TaxID=72036 RepID=UPI001AE18F1C|nr:rac GTPase-activating protein 1-like [Lepeophtheirus salmonis]